MPPTTQRPTITPEGQAAAKRIAAARAERNANPTSVTADQLSQPVSQVTVPQPQVAETTPVNDNMVKGVGTNTQNIIAAQTQEAADLKALRDQQAQIAGEGTLSELFSLQQEQFGIPENLKTLQDLQLQMADMDTESNITQTRIGQGNSISQGNREITQEQRENAVRQAGTAARAAILQGNIETASALVSQAVQTAYQDRTLRNSNLINQINSLQGVVDGQTAQLLETDKRKYEADQAVIQRVADAVDDAMNSGAATQEDIRTLTDPKLSDEDRLAAAQGIVSRGQTQLRDLEVRQSEASIRSSNASAALNEKALRDQEKAVEEGVLTPEQASLATDLRKERNALQEVKDAKDLEGGFVGLISALDQENGVGDISAINSFQRLAVDPGVAVREGDVALLQTAQSFGDQALLRAQGLMVGDKLTPEARTQMRTLSAQIYDSRVGFVEDNTAQLRTIAEENNIDYNKYVGKSFVDSATLLNNLNKVVFEVVTPTSTGITFEDGTEFVLPNP